MSALLTDPDVWDISISGRLTLEDVLELDRCEAALKAPPSKQAGIRFVWFALLLYFCEKLRDGYQPVLAIGALLCAWFAFAGGYFARLSIRSRHRRHPELLMDHTAVFSGSFISCASAVHEMRAKWEAVSMIVQARGGLIFYLSPRRRWFYLPARVFDSGETRESILALAADHAVRIVPLPE